MTGPVAKERTDNLPNTPEQQRLIGCPYSACSLPIDEGVARISR